MSQFIISCVQELSRTPSAICVFGNGRHTQAAPTETMFPSSSFTIFPLLILATAAQGLDDNDETLMESSVLLPTPSPSLLPEPPSNGEPIITGDAIANIVCSVSAIILLTSLLCYTSYTFSRRERRTRTKTALANNKLIDQQIAAAKANAEQRAKNTSQGLLYKESGTNQAQFVSSGPVAVVGGASDIVMKPPDEDVETNLSDGNETVVELKSSPKKLDQDQT